MPQSTARQIDGREIFRRDGRRRTEGRVIQHLQILTTCTTRSNWIESLGYRVVDEALWPLEADKDNAAVIAAVDAVNNAQFPVPQH